MDEYYQVMQTLPQWLARPLGQLPSEDAETVHELRLRLGCAPQFTVQGCSCTPTQLRRFSPYPSDRDRTGLCYTGKWLSGRAWRAFFAKPGTGHGSAGAYLCQPAHCPGKDRSASTGTDRSIAGAFHRDASCWRAGQRQDHIAAHPHGAGSSSGRIRSFRSLMNGGSSLPGMHPARRWMFLPGSPRDKQCRWHCAPSRHR